MDPYSRRVVGWELGEDLRVKLAVGALPTSSGFLSLFFKTDPCATGSAGPRPADPERTLSLVHGSDRECGRMQPDAPVRCPGLPLGLRSSSYIAPSLPATPGRCR